MSESLRHHFDSLRIAANRLNAITEEACRLIRSVESALAEIGISAETSPFVVEADRGREIECRLMCGRVRGKFHVSVLIEGEPKPWSSCSRAVKLGAVTILPELVRLLADRMEGLIDRTEETSRLVMEAIGPDQSASPRAGPAWCGESTPGVAWQARRVGAGGARRGRARSG